MRGSRRHMCAPFMSLDTEPCSRTRGDHLMLNAYRVESLSEIPNYPRVKQWLTSGTVEVMAVGSGNGKQKRNVKKVN